MTTFLRALSALPLLALCANAQGPLTPPGAPAPTMKTLAQVEPRTSVQTLAAAPPYVITQPGSYYLTDNITVIGENAITIQAAGVTLDLEGFTISSTYGSASSSNAIDIKNGSHDCRIQNGSIRSGSVVSDTGVTVAGFSHGISVETQNANGTYNLSVDNLSIHGLGGTGIALGYDGVVSRCRIYHCGTGILAGSAESCTVEYTASHAIQCSKSVVNSRGNSRLSGDGISATTVSNSIGFSTNARGISATTVENSGGGSVNNTAISANIVTGSRGVSEGGPGIQAEKISDCDGQSTSGAGIQGTTVNNSTGTSSFSYGITGTTVSNSSGTSYTGTGLQAETASHCKGASSYGGGMIVSSGDNCVGTSAGYQPGIQAENLNNCKGTSLGTGLRAFANATNCYGKSNNGASPPAGVSRIGIWVDGTASFCRGDHASSSGTSIQAGIAVACTYANGPISANKQLGTP